MTQPEFQHQITRLAEAFGKTHFSPERVKIIWRDCGTLTSAWLEKIVDGFISTQRQAPMPADFQNAAIEERNRAWEREKKSRPEAPWAAAANCYYCRDMGVYCCRHPERGGLWAFRCHCDRGRMDTRSQIPIFTQSHAEEGFAWVELERRHA